MPRLDQREEDVILAHKAGQRRNPRKRKHKNEQQHRRCRAALVEAVQVVEFIADQSLPPQHNDDGESADGHERIDKQIEGDALQARLVSIRPAHRRHQPQKDVADVRDRRIRQQPFDVGLRDRREIAQRQRSNGNGRDDSYPVHAHRPESI